MVCCIPSLLVGFRKVYSARREADLVMSSVTTDFPVNQDLPVDRSTLCDHAGRFLQSNFKLLSFLLCP